MAQAADCQRAPAKHACCGLAAALDTLPRRILDSKTALKQQTVPTRPNLNLSTTNPARHAQPPSPPSQPHDMDASAPGAPPGSPRHAVYVQPSGGAATAAAQLTPLLEPSLVDVLLVQARHTLTLFDHFTIEAARGNEHTMELLAGALALHVRLHAAAATGVLCPLLEERASGGGGGAGAPADAAQLAADVAGRVRALEADELEALTMRRARDWRGLAAAVQRMHQVAVQAGAQGRRRVWLTLRAALELAWELGRPKPLGRCPWTFLHRPRRALPAWCTRWRRRHSRAWPPAWRRWARERNSLPLCTHVAGGGRRVGWR